MNQRGNLDADNAKVVMDLLRYLNEQLGKTIIVVTHDKDLITSTDIELDLSN